MEHGHIQGLPKFFEYPLLYQERIKLRTSNFVRTFLVSIRTTVHKKISGAVAGCVVRTLKTFKCTHILGASRGLLCDSYAVLLIIPSTTGVLRRLVFTKTILGAPDLAASRWESLQRSPNILVRWGEGRSLPIAPSTPWASRSGRLRGFASYTTTPLPTINSWLRDYVVKHDSDYAIDSCYCHTCRN